MGTQAGSRICGVLIPKGLFKIATAGAYLQSVAIVPDHQFSDLPFLEFCWSFIFSLPDIATRLPDHLPSSCTALPPDYLLSEKPETFF